MAITKEVIAKMIETIQHYDDMGWDEIGKRHTGLSWQFYAGLGGVGDLRNVPPGERIAYVHHELRRPVVPEWIQFLLPENEIAIP